MDSKIILLVEDTLDDEELTRMALRENNISTELVVAHDGSEALDYLFATGIHEDKEPLKPAVTLLDLRLPKVSGLDVLKRMRADERTRTLPVVMLTSSTDRDDLQQSYALGCNSFLRKPIVFEQYVSALGLVGNYWLNFNEPPPLERTAAA